jgi:hypothetical protein
MYGSQGQGGPAAAGPACRARQGQGGVQCLTAQLDTEISECSDLLLLVGLVHMDGQLRTQVDAHGHAAAGCCCCGGGAGAAAASVRGGGDPEIDR